MTRLSTLTLAVIAVTTIACGTKTTPSGTPSNTQFTFTAAISAANEIQPGQLRHQIVDDDEIERALAKQTEGVARTARRRDVVTIVAERLGERLPNLRLVVNEQHRPSRHVTMPATDRRRVLARATLARVRAAAGFGGANGLRHY